MAGYIYRPEAQRATVGNPDDRIEDEKNYKK